jgi:hypothetical protein
MSSEAAAPALRLAVKLAGLDLGFVPIEKADVRCDVWTLVKLVLEERASKLPGREPSDLALYYAGPEPPDDEATVLRGKPAAALTPLRAIVGDTRTAYFLVEVGKGALLGGGAVAASAAAAAGASRASLGSVYVRPREMTATACNVLVVCLTVASRAGASSPPYQCRGVAGVTDHFRALLAGAGVAVDEAVVRRVFSSPAMAVQLQVLSTKEEALDLYGMAERIPQTETRANVRRESGIVVGGDISMPHLSSALFFWAMEGLVPRVLKIPAVQSAVMRECRLFDELGTAAAMEGVALMPVRHLALRGSHRGDVRTTDSVTLQHGVLMPHYPLTLAQLPPPSVAAGGVVVFDRIAAALAFLARAGWLHGDVKPSNIFIDASGSVWLGDYGSSVRVADAAAHFTGGTPQFQVEGIPCDAAGGLFDRSGLVVTFVCALGLLSASSRVPAPWPPAVIRAAVERVELSVLRQRLEAAIVGALDGPPVAVGVAREYSSEQDGLAGVKP